MSLATVQKLSVEQLRAWCAFLASAHRALDTLGVHAEVYMPLTGRCPRRRGDLAGCGTCYHCQQEMIKRTLLMSSLPAGQVDVAAHSIGDQVYDYVTRLDETLGDELHDDYAAMDPGRYARVMVWASEEQPGAAPFLPQPGEEGAFLAAMVADLGAVLYSVPGAVQAGAATPVLLNGSQW